ncbi:lytic transglycosylase domain-containing protein [Croceicoccus hydrothermalis]|jgi:soluble lytic murein transglycosylase-like protein|uniref:lytic transglycosylase domain-containing protein n=1 Tax=Croceicoccus hydrothermalis TaxID=2867964 RepID=UPI001EFB4798|nr:lytic transglycosylase domain-containing protein [Croceicoccus hydrothermalis]
MTRKWAVAAAAATGIGLTVTAHAQEQQSSDGLAAMERTTAGFRVTEGSAGFLLVEHDIWPTQPATAAEMPVADTVPTDLLYRQRHRQGSTPSGFRRASYLPHVHAAEARYALPRGLLDALVWTESRYNPLAVSKAGAAGLGQLMPGTARDLGVSNRFDPVANVFGAAKYLRQMLDKFGVVPLALAAYNAGPGAVDRAGGIPRNGETPAYVREVLRQWRF